MALNFDHQRDRVSSASRTITINTTGSLTVPVGSTPERPTAARGMIRYNTTDSRFEAYDGVVWSGLGGVIDADQNTYIIAESSPGANNNELDFYTNGVKRLQIGSTGNLLFGDTLSKFTVAYASGNTVIAGTLASGATTVDVLNVKDTAIVLNSDQLGIPGSDVYITVERGTSNNVNLRWNETSEVWEQTSDGTTYYRILSTDDDYIATITAGTGISVSHTPSAGSTATISTANIPNSSLTNSAITITDGATSQVIDLGETITFADGTDINVVVSATNSVTVNNTSTFDTVTDRGATTTNNITVGGATVSNLTNNRIVVAGTAGVLSDSANLTFDGSILTATAQVNVTGDLDVDNININGNTISSTNTNGNIVIESNGTGDIQLNADTVRVGDSNSTVLITSNGTGNIRLDTNAGVNSGYVLINAGANSDVQIEANGTGSIYNTAAKLILGKSNAAASVTTNGTGNLTLNTNSGTNSGSIVLTQGVDGNITLTPNGSGEVVISTVVVNDLTVNRIVFAGASGALQDSALFRFDGTNFDIGASGSEKFRVSVASGNTTVNGSLIFATGVSVNTILDEDTMSSNSASALATQQSIKAYVDTATAANSLATAGGTGTGSVNLSSQTLTVAGTTNEIETSASGQTITIGLPDNVNIGNNLTVTGNLTVNGTTTTVNSLNIKDTAILLNSDEMGNPTSDVYITVERGTSNNVNLRWNETTDVWEQTSNGTNYYRIVSTDDDYIANLTAGTGISISHTPSAGSTATISTANIPNSSLTNSAITITDGATSQIIDLGETITFADGTDINVVVSATNTVTVNHNVSGANTSASAATNTFANSFTVTSQGHVTAIGTGIVNFNVADNYAFKSITDGTNTAIADSNTDTFKIRSAQQITATVTSDDITHGDSVLIGHSNSGVTANTYGSTTTIPVITVDAQGHITGASTINNQWTITDGTTSQIVNNGDTLTLADGTDINVVVSATDTVTVNNTSTLNTVTGRGATTTNTITVGGATVSNLTNNRIVIAGTAGVLSGSANLTFDGSVLNTSAQVNIVGDLDVDNININGNTISSTDTNGNITLTPNGTGSVVISSNTTVNGSLIFATGVSVNTILDEDTMSSNSASALATQQSIKAYVDSATAANSLATAGGTGTGSVNLSSQILTIAGTTNEIETSASGQIITIGLPDNVTIGNNLTVTGNLTVNGTTTTVNSTTVTVDDPIFTLGGDTAPSSDDNKDRGIEFRYYNGSAKVGFFGFDDSTGYFTFIPDATNTGEVFSGTKGMLDVTSVTGSAASWTTARTITLGGDLTGNVSIDGSANVTLTATVAANSVALGTDTTGNYVTSITNGTYITGGDGGSEGAAITLAVDATSTNTVSKVVARDASGNFAAGTITAALSGNATTASAWATARTITLNGDLTGSVSVNGSADVTLTATVAANSVALGTDTTGNYVTSIANGSYILGGNSGSESAALTLSVDATTTNTASKIVARDAIGNFSAGTITAALSGNATTASAWATARTITLNGDLTGSVSINGSADVTLTATVAVNSIALGTDTTGDYVATVGAGTSSTQTGSSGLTITGTGEGSSVTIAHADTSSVSNLSSDNSNGIVIQDVAFTFDTYGHVTAASVVTTDLDNRYYTETEADNNFVNVSGDTLTGYLTLHADPVNALHAVTKQYVDAVSEGLHVHASCRVATTDTLAVLSGGTITYDNGASGVGATLTTTGSYTTIDTVTLANTNRILVKNQANTAHNGIYVRTSSTVLTRADDSDSSAEMQGGDFVFVTEGVEYDNTGWVQETSVTTVGTSAVVFVQFSGAGTFTAGTGLQLIGSEFSIDSTVVTLTGSQTLTNKTLTSPSISGLYISNGSIQFEGATADAFETTLSVTDPTADRTITLPDINGTVITSGDTGTVTNTMLAGSIANSKLSNSSVTVGSTNIALGATSTTLAGLTSVTSTSFVGALTGNASTASTWATARTITLNGDLTGSVSINGSADVTLTATVAANSVALGTDTTGNYVTSITNGTYILGADGGSESAALTLSVDATSANTVSKIVARDVSGNFAAGTITAALSGNATTASAWATARTITLGGDLTGNVSISGSADVTLTATIAANSVALGTDTTGNYVTSITNGSYILGGNGGSEGAALTLAVDATSANTASKVVARDASGNFAAGTITAALTGNASTATTATTLATSRTLWGQNFDGSANVTGDLTSVGNITGSGEITIAAGGTNQNILLTPSGTGNVGIGTATPGAQLELAETWNSGDTVFTHIKSNVTDTASAAGSLLMDLQVGGSSKFKVSKSGAGTFGSSVFVSGQTNSGIEYTGFKTVILHEGSPRLTLQTGIVSLNPADALAWRDTNTVLASTDLYLYRDAADTLAQRNGTTAQTLRIYNTFTDTSNYERGIFAWSSNVLQIGTEAAGTGTRRQINLNYTTTIDGGSRTNVAALTITNVGAGTGGIALGVLSIGHAQDQTRITGFDVANKALGYSVRGSAVSGQGAHRFSGDANTGTSVGATGSIVDILAPSTATNIFQCRQSDGTVTLNVGYSGAVTIANTVTQSTEATTLATVTKTQVASFPVASFRSGKLIVQAYNSVTGEVQISELLVAHNGTTASATEYGIVFTGTVSFVTYDVDILSGNVRLMVTNTTANSTQYKVSETLMVA